MHLETSACNNLLYYIEVQRRIGDKMRKMEMTLVNTDSDTEARSPKILPFFPLTGDTPVIKYTIRRRVH